MQPHPDRAGHVALGDRAARPRRLPARLVASVMFVITAAVNLPAPLYATYTAHAGLGTTAASLAFACYVAGLVPVLVFLGGISDHVGRKIPLLCASVLSGGAIALLILSPNIVSLGVGRLLLGVATGLTTGSGPAYVVELLTRFEDFSAEDASRRGSFIVTASTALGFGVGALVTGLWLMRGGAETLVPGSYFAYLPLSALACVGLLVMPPERVGVVSSSWMRLPTFTPGSGLYALAIANAWAAVGLVISILPAALRAQGLTSWSGVMTFLVISGGFLAQPMSRRMKPLSSLRAGLLLGPTGFAALAAGATLPSVTLILVGATLIGFSAYGFTYLGGLTKVIETSSKDDRARATSGYFLIAYFGFSVPVITFAALADLVGITFSLISFLALISVISGSIWVSLRTRETGLA